MIELSTKSSEVKLIEPDVERDAQVAVAWLAGEAGRNTLRLMGNTEEDNKPSTLEEERERIRGFLSSEDQLTWMISLSGKTVGAVWVDKEPTEYLPGPSVHIMIGDQEAKGRGVGSSAIEAVTDHMRQSYDFPIIYSRHLLSNEIIIKLLKQIGFSDLGQPYKDSDGLEFQNVQLEL